MRLFTRPGSSGARIRHRRNTLGFEQNLPNLFTKSRFIHVRSPLFSSPPGRGPGGTQQVPAFLVAKTMPNLCRPRKIVADTRRGSATRGRASACAACAVYDECAVCADRRPAGQHAGRCVRRAATLKVPACRTYDPTPARARKSTLRADCNADVTAPSTGIDPRVLPTTGTTGIDRRRSEHRGPRGLGGWRDEATETSGGRLARWVSAPTAQEMTFLARSAASRRDAALSGVVVLSGRRLRRMPRGCERTTQPSSEGPGRCDGGSTGSCAGCNAGESPRCVRPGRPN